MEDLTKERTRNEKTTKNNSEKVTKGEAKHHPPIYYVCTNVVMIISNTIEQQRSSILLWPLHKQRFLGPRQRLSTSRASLEQYCLLVVFALNSTRLDWTCGVKVRRLRKIIKVSETRYSCLVDIVLE